MNTIDISRAYALIRQLAGRGGAYSPGELSQLDTEVQKANSSLIETMTAFADSLARAESAIMRCDDNSLAGELIRVRMSAMNVVADFDNLVDEISGLFERDAVREVKIEGDRN